MCVIKTCNINSIVPDSTLYELIKRTLRILKYEKNVAGIKMPDNPEDKLLILQLSEDSKKLPGFFQVTPQSEFLNCLIRTRCRQEITKL